MLRRLVIVLGGLMLVGCLIAGWLAYYPESQMFATMGIAGPRASSGRACGGYYRRTAIGLIPTRDMTCGREIDSSMHLVYWEQVSVDRLTRKLKRASVMWVWPDSIGAGAREDSIARAMVAEGGHEVSCSQNPYAALLRQHPVRYWKFDDYTIRLYSAAWSQTPVPKPEWTIQILGDPGLYEACVHDPWRHNRSAAGSSIRTSSLSRQLPKLSLESDRSNHRL